jgi:hypothetical protein
MNSELEAIRDAMNPDSGAGQDIDTAHQLADKYVTDHPDVFASLTDMTLEECVKAVEAFRDNNMEDNQHQIETWLLHKWEPQNIGGTANPTLRLHQ